MFRKERRGEVHIGPVIEGSIPDNFTLLDLKKILRKFRLWLPSADLNRTMTGQKISAKRKAPRGPKF